MSNLASLLVYFVLFFASTALLSFGIKRSSRLLRLIAVAIPTIAVGLRVDVGTDYNSYVLLYQKFSEMSFSDLMAATGDEDLEIGYFALIKLASVFTNDPWLMFMLAASLTIGIAYLAIKRLSPKNIPLTFLLYLLILVPFIMNGVRQGIAVSIIFFAYSYIIRGKLTKYVITVLIASLFHTSALALMPLYLLRFITVKKRIDEPFTLLMSAFLGVITVLLIPTILTIISFIPALNTYLRYEDWEGGKALYPLVSMAILTPIVIVTYQRLTKINPVMQLMAALFFLEFATLFLGGISTAFSRMSFYFAIGGLVYIANVPSIFSVDTRRIVQSMIVLYGLVYFIMFYYIAGYADIIPYNNIWGDY